MSTVTALHVLCSILYRVYISYPVTQANISVTILCFVFIMKYMCSFGLLFFSHGGSWRFVCDFCNLLWEHGYTEPCRLNKW